LYVLLKSMPVEYRLNQTNVVARPLQGPAKSLGSTGAALDSVLGLKGIGLIKVDPAKIADENHSHDTFQTRTTGGPVLPASAD